MRVLVSLGTAWMQSRSRKGGLWLNLCMCKVFPGMFHVWYMLLIGCTWSCFHQTTSTTTTDLIKQKKWIELNGGKIYGELRAKFVCDFKHTQWQKHANCTHDESLAYLGLICSAHAVYSVAQVTVTSAPPWWGYINSSTHRFIKSWTYLHPRSIIR